MTRIDQRTPDQLRSTAIQPQYLLHPEGSVLIAAGQTQTLKLKLPKKGKKLFKQKRKLAANATLALAGPPLQASTETEQLKVKGKKKRK